MFLRKIDIKNFRLLRDVSLLLEEQTTVIVGRNNSGKTSLAELFRRLLSDKTISFQLEDFHLGVHEQFWKAFTLKESAKDEEIREMLPVIEVKLVISYTELTSTLSEFVIELDPNCNEAWIIIRYQLANGKIKPFFDNIDLSSQESDDDKKTKFFRIIKERIPEYFKAVMLTQAPNDSTNQKILDWGVFRDLLQSGFINAQRGLDDATHKERDVLGKIIGVLFSTAMSISASSNDRSIAQKLDDSIQQIQSDINISFTEQLKQLIPAFSLFGYPGLPDPRLRTETQLDVQGLLDNNTKIRYTGTNGVHLPETYNGLGARNLIFILLKLVEFYKLFAASQPMPGICLIFIEEPEAHLHPQMQEVFVGKLSEIAHEFNKTYGGETWPVQFVITTHSPHIANRTPFDTMRYFLAIPESLQSDICYTKIKDLKKGFTDTPNDDKEFLYQYMTLTRCDLLFADKAILIEGTSERLLLPKMLEKIDQKQINPVKKLTSQYISIMEVGGAYAHIFFGLLDFLELRSLIITDLDSIDHNSNREACKVSSGTHTSNACITKWFRNSDITPSTLINKPEIEKIDQIRCIAYQVPELIHQPCGRSFEDAFMLANPELFNLDKSASFEQKEDIVWNKAQKIKKSEFALKHAIRSTEWNVPKYIADGLNWLAETYSESNPIADPSLGLDTGLSYKPGDVL